MRGARRPRANLGFALALAVLLAMGTVSYRSTRQLIDTADWVEHTRQVIEAVSTLGAALSEAESARRGHVLTGDLQHLETYERALPAVAHNLKRLRALTGDDPNQERRLGMLEPRIRERLHNLTRSLEHYRSNPEDVDGQREMTRQGTIMTDRIKTDLTEMRSAEETLLGRRETAARRSARFTLWIIVMGSAAAVAFVVFGGRALRREEADRRRAEEARRLSEERLRLAVTGASVGTWHWRLPSDELLWSEQCKACFGLPPDVTLSYERFLALLHPEDRERARQAVSRALDEGTEYDTEFRAIWPDGSVHWIAAKGRAYYDESGQPLSMEGIVLDVSDRKRAFQEIEALNQELAERSRQAQEASRMKSEFLANMSHELRTPLNAIIGFAQLMHDGKVGPLSSEHREYLGDILTSARHLLTIINDILDLAKVESGQLRFSPESVEASALVREVADIVAVQAAAKRITLDTAIAADLGALVLDAAKLKQVLYNYVSNALKFTPEGGRVTIRARPQGTDAVRLEVQDSGPGIAPEDQPRLFSAFQQLDAGPGKRHEGTGLGLALVKRIVEAQGGRVGVSSRLGEGSLFFVELPLRSAHPGSAEARPAVGPAPVSERAATILVIEDDPGDADWIETHLTKAGYAVVRALTAAQAQALTRERTFSAITLDLLLPDGSGLDVLRSLASGLNRKTPVLVLTVVQEENATGPYAVHAFLKKPLLPEHLVEALRAAGVPPTAAGTVLVVDDDPQALKLAAASLTPLGYRVSLAPDGPSGLHAVAVSPPDAIVLDLLMPGMDGFAFLRELRRNPDGRQPPVIVWTVKDLTAEERTLLERLTQGIVLKRTGSLEPLLAAIAGELRETRRTDEA